MAHCIKTRFLGNYSENSMGCVQVDFIQALLPEFPKKSNSCIIYQQNQNKRFLFLPWSQSAPSRAKNGSYKKVIVVSLFSNISIIYIIICICIYLNLCALQYLFNKVLYQSASKRDIQHIRPFAQSAHATIHSKLTQPLATL
jgi:hypothetical protein